MSAAPPIARWCAAALLVTPDGRYLMQLRDDKPGILLPDHWALFGGTIDPGETAAAAMRRELAEELEFHARAVDAFSEMVVELPLDPPRFDRMSFFAVPITTSGEAAMVQHEGAGRRLFTPEALAAERRVAPWDLAAVLMHARRTQLFRR
ncbi:MAG TPA: NUDIX domain-containing protein [Stellaceae bacterium]